MRKRAILFGLFLLPSIVTFALNNSDAQWIDKVANFYGERAGKRVAAWRNVVTESAELSELEKLSAVNNFFNQLYFVNDIDLWGKKDYWATPLEFLGSAARRL